MCITEDLGHGSHARMKGQSGEWAKNCFYFYPVYDMYTFEKKREKKKIELEMEKSLFPVLYPRALYQKRRRIHALVYLLRLRLLISFLEKKTRTRNSDTIYLRQERANIDRIDENGSLSLFFSLWLDIDI